MVRLVVSYGVPWCSLRVALVVGTVLTLLNQGDQILVRGLGSVDTVKALFTYLIPYLVSTYGAVSARLRDVPGE